MNPRPLPAVTEEREDPAERAIHDVHEAVSRLWELVPPQTADWVVLCANIAADKKYRERSRS